MSTISQDALDLLPELRKALEAQILESCGWTGDSIAGPECACEESDCPCHSVGFVEVHGRIPDPRWAPMLDVVTFSLHGPVFTRDWMGLPQGALAGAIYAIAYECPDREHLRPEFMLLAHGLAGIFTEPDPDRAAVLAVLDMLKAKEVEHDR